jgi:hypothetical protein
LPRIVSEVIGYRSDHLIGNRWIFAATHLDERGIAEWLMSSVMGD